MNPVLEIALWLLGIFLASFGIAYILTGKKPKANQLPTLPEGTFWRLRTSSGLYRVRFIQRQGQELIVDAPLDKNAYVPLRVGESLQVEAPAFGGCVAFRTEVVSRGAESKQLHLAIPSQVLNQNRRQHPRECFPETAFSRLNGEPSALINISMGGARVISRAEVSVGDWIRLETLDDEKIGCVLEVLPDSLDGRRANNLRLVFAEPSV